MSGSEARRGDVITLTGVRAHGRHGVLESERREGQVFVVDLELGLPLGPAARSDELGRTVNYAEVAALVVEVVEGEPKDLIEAVAGHVADLVLAQQPLVETIAVTVHKPQAPVGVPFADVAVTVRRRRDVPVVIALGANLADPSATVQRTARRLARGRGLRGVRVSALYRTAPVGGPPQPDFVNAVAVGRTGRSAASLLQLLQELETTAGRSRGERWGPRILDLDLVQYGDPEQGTDLVSDTPHLELPHPRAHERAFVLVPWLAVDGSAALRVGDQVRPVAELVGEVDTSGVLRWEQS
ncbi:MAG: 2-amino-4-hydroxy-6-hydroxymethyldihydropteridine diphosphokinase [Ornithinimicrobium sp.]|uniref:2-amino-4-hydroxy-6- hydroxymethyldihydropteridine diphosphokinase n=1 Tax=Ornithinimicrobium sp. TaxID=1977084 RepID=UPI003D9AE7AE